MVKFICQKENKYILNEGKMEEKRLDISSLVWYFLIFSILGLIIETLYCYITTGVLESRQGLVYGPFCPIYGCGAVIYIIFLNRYKDSSELKLFFTGAVLGSIVEYLLSFSMEAIYSNRFWDYSYTKYHINGRISLTYTVFWGVLAIALIKYLKPIIDFIIDKINIRIRRKLEIAIILFFIVDGLLTVWAVKSYTMRAEQVYWNSIENVEKINRQDRIEDVLFTNEKMIRTFPNIRIKGKDGNEIWARSVF